MLINLRECARPHGNVVSGSNIDNLKIQNNKRKCHFLLLLLLELPISFSVKMEYHFFLNENITKQNETFVNMRALYIYSVIVSVCH